MMAHCLKISALVGIVLGRGVLARAENDMPPDDRFRREVSGASYDEATTQFGRHAFRSNWPALFTTEVPLVSNQRYSESAEPHVGARHVRTHSDSSASGPGRDAFDTSVDTKTDGAATVDGTWREEGQFVVINLNGQQYRLVKSQATQETALPVESTGGQVYGRLFHRGSPLVDCEVALVRLRKTWTGYAIASIAESDLPTTLTDVAGIYHFAGVPPGTYKLKWRPAGHDGWIRRAEIRPDVRVRTDERAQVRDIRVALRTIN